MACAALCSVASLVFLPAPEGDLPGAKKRFKEAAAYRSKESIFWASKASFHFQAIKVCKPNLMCMPIHDVRSRTALPHVAL